jgi:ACS family hexuronate transporter-like MFS transporter
VATNVEGARRGDSVEHAAALGRYRWVICTLLFCATAVNYIDRQILALLKPVLDHDLGWTNAEYGKVTAAFQGSYALGLLFFGPFVDRVGSKIGYALSIAAWSLAAMAHAGAGSVAGFVRARMALGVSEGGNFPSAIKSVAAWFPKRERAFATALFNSGANVGAILAPAIVPWLAFNWGWQSAFVVAGIAGFVWLLFWWLFYDEPERVRRLSAGELAHIRSDAPEASDEGARPGWLGILKKRQAWSFIVAKALTDPIWWFFLTWLPDYFKNARGLDIRQSWLHLVTIYSIVTVLSIAGGWIPGALVKRGMGISRARKAAMFLFACLVLPVFAVTQVGVWPAVLIIGLAGAAHQAWSANLFTSVSDMFPKRAVASVVGVGGMAGSIGGIFLPIYTGKLLDTFSAAHNVSAGYAILFSICGSAYLIAFACNHALAPRFELTALPASAPRG